ncbi:MAG TPA: 50S ribosomal protein L30 [Bacteroidetes bacterium]|nr:50S ribosomal protein L30 [Bacteroidota bacterium]
MVKSCEMIKITQVRSSIKKSKKQKATLIALGLRGIGKSVEKDVNDQINGMVAKVSHLVKVEEV